MIAKGYQDQNLVQKLIGSSASLLKTPKTPLGNHAARRNDTGISSLEQDEVENDVDTELYVGENAKEDEDEDEDFTLDDDIEDEQISEENDEEEDTYEEDSDDDEDGKRKGQEQDENDIENHIRKERVRKKKKNHSNRG